MSSKTIRFLRTYFILFWVVAICCAILTTDSFTAYTKANKAKRVTASYDDVGSRFSSNYMDEWGSGLDTDISFKPIYVMSTDTAISRTVKVTICNFARGVQGYPYDRSINYTFSAKPVYIDNNGVMHDAAAADMGSKVITLSLNSSDGALNSSDVSEFTASGTLLRGQASIDNCSITFNRYFVTETQEGTYSGRKIYLFMTASPVGEEYNDLNALSCLMYFTLDEAVEGGHWKGYFNDQGADTENGDASGFDGYNYVIEGVGTGDGYLKWNKEFLELNAESHRALGSESITTDENGWYQLKIELDSNDIGRYDIQFYQTYTAENRNIYDNWNNINDMVQFIPPN